MNIILDAMSGDKAPLEIIKGAAMALKQYDVQLTLVGNREIITRIAAEQGLSLDGVRIEHTEEIITMEDDPISVVRAKKNSSMAVGLRMLKEEGDAFVSAGNTGALHAGSSLIVRPIKGIQRAAIATVLPLAKPMLMLDSGANTNVTAEYMLQWAVMGSIYMKNIFGIDSPAVGLLNNGAESHKGTPVVAEAHKIMAESREIRFVGNVEGNQVVSSPCDVLVADGFTGNITLKLLEGMGKFFMGSLKGMYTKNALTKMSFLVMKDQLRAFKKQFDASEHGGAPLLGLRKPVIKAHGSSDAAAICNAVRQAMTFVRTGVIDEITEYVAAHTPPKPSASDKAETAEETTDAT
ncbi:MAG: phosphate acyltransferase PlsX [Clostridia bacterium]|nr:phosphate acyltransferase PlsX [Clostridia bacterium]